MMQRIIPAMLLLAGTSVLASPPYGRDATPEVQAAVLRFFDGMEQGDAALLVQTIWADPASSSQDRQRRQFAELVAAQIELERTAARQFGAAARRLGSGIGLLITPADREAVGRSKVYVDDPAYARMEKEGETTPIRLRRTQRTGWQVVLNIVDNEPLDDGGYSALRPDSMSRIRLDRVKGLGEAFREVRRRVESGELGTAAAAEADLLDRLNKVHQEYMRRRNSLPERRFFSDGR